VVNSAWGLVSAAEGNSQNVNTKGTNSIQKSDGGESIGRVERAVVKYQEFGKGGVG